MFDGQIRYLPINTLTSEPVLRPEHDTGKVFSKTYEGAHSLLPAQTLPTLIVFFAFQSLSPLASPIAAVLIMMINTLKDKKMSHHLL